MQLNGSDIVCEVLLEQGVDTVFGYPGGAALNIYDALYKYQNKIRHIMTAHEQGAAHAADGYARSTGRVGVCLSTSGPGATNLVTGIATAYMDSVPMVAITSNVGTAQIGNDAFQEIYITGITMPITKHNYLVKSVEELAPTLREAFKIANSGRKGPVLVDIPKDISAELCEFTQDRIQPLQEHSVINEEKVIRVAAILNKAKRPLIEIGGGVETSDASELVKRLVEKTGVPCCHTLMASGVIGYGEELNLGLIGMHGNFAANRAAADCDVLLAIGTRFSDRVALNPRQFAKKAKIIQIDIDPSEINKNVMVDEYLIGDVKEIVLALLHYVKLNSHKEWLEKLAELDKNKYIPDRKQNKLLPSEIIHEMCSQLPSDAIYATDVGQHQMWAAQYIEKITPRSFLTSGGLGTMGYGYGAAIGAQAAFPEKRVVHITSDGSLHMNMNEACTAVSYNLPIITVIFDNAVLGMVRQWQKLIYEERYSSTDPKRKTDYLKMIEAFGGKGYEAKTLEEFKNTFKKALNDNVPVWIRCEIDKDEKVLPMIPAGKTVNDIIMTDN